MSFLFRRYRSVLCSDLVRTVHYEDETESLYFSQSKRGPIAFHTYVTTSRSGHGRVTSYAGEATNDALDEFLELLDVRFFR